MKKRHLILALVLLLLFGLLAGCATSRAGGAPVNAGSTPIVQDKAPVLPTQPPVAPADTETTIPEDKTPLTSAYPTPDPDMISQQLAMDIALLHAGVHADEAEFMQVEFDWDHGRAEFDVQFHVGRTEYEYEIDAASGSIISHEKDYD